MSDDFNIPPEAVEAARKAFRVTDLEPAIRAALAAWPGMRVSMLFPPNEPHVVLPLNTENPDAV